MPSPRPRAVFLSAACLLAMLGCQGAPAAAKTPAEEYALARAYRDGNGVAKDEAQYRHWLETAANHGEGEASFEMACLHLKGIDTPKGLDQALAWAEKAAQQGHVPAMSTAGSLWLAKKDLAKARAWADAGAKADDPGSMRLMGAIHLLEHRGAEAIVCFRRAAFRGDAEAMLALGSLYYTGGDGIPQDYAKALEWLLLAAAKDNAHAKTGLGALYHHGYGVPKDDRQAVEFLYAAAMQGDDNAKDRLKDWYGLATPAETDRWLKAHEKSPASAP